MRILSHEKGVRQAALTWGTLAVLKPRLLVEERKLVEARRLEDGVLRAKGGKRNQSLARKITEQKDEIIAILAPSHPGDDRGDLRPLCSGDGTETSPNAANDGVSSPREAENRQPGKAEEVRFWLGLVRDGGCRIELKDGMPTIDCAAGMATPGRLADWRANLPVITQILQAEAGSLSQRRTKEQRREPPPHPPVVPDAILAAPRIVCPACSSRPVLPELRAMTGGLCYRCWEERPS